MNNSQQAYPREVSMDGRQPNHRKENVIAERLDSIYKSDNSLFGYYFIETDVLLTLDKKTNLEYHQTKKQRVKLAITECEPKGYFHGITIKRKISDQLYASDRTCLQNKLCRMRVRKTYFKYF